MQSSAHKVDVGIIECYLKILEGFVKIKQNQKGAW